MPPAVHSGSLQSLDKSPSFHCYAARQAAAAAKKLPSLAIDVGTVRMHSRDYESSISLASHLPPRGGGGGTQDFIPSPSSCPLMTSPCTLNAVCTTPRGHPDLFQASASGELARRRPGEGGPRPELPCPWSLGFLAQTSSLADRQVARDFSLLALQNRPLPVIDVSGDLALIARERAAQGERRAGAPAHVGDVYEVVPLTALAVVDPDASQLLTWHVIVISKEAARECESMSPHGSWKASPQGSPSPQLSPASRGLACILAAVQPVRELRAPAGWLAELVERVAAWFAEQGSPFGPSIPSVWGHPCSRRTTAEIISGAHSSWKRLHARASCPGWCCCPFSGLKGSSPRAAGGTSTTPTAGARPAAAHASAAAHAAAAARFALRSNSTSALLPQPPEGPRTAPSRPRSSAGRAPAEQQQQQRALRQRRDPLLLTIDVAAAEGRAPGQQEGRGRWVRPPLSCLPRVTSSSFTEGSTTAATAGRPPLMRPASPAQQGARSRRLSHGGDPASPLQQLWASGSGGAEGAPATVLPPAGYGGGARREGRRREESRLLLRRWSGSRASSEGEGGQAEAEAEATLGASSAAGGSLLEGGEMAAVAAMAAAGAAAAAVAAAGPGHRSPTHSRSRHHPTQSWSEGRGSGAATQGLAGVAAEEGLGSAAKAGTVGRAAQAGLAASRQLGAGSRPEAWKQQRQLLAIRPPETPFDAAAAPGSAAERQALGPMSARVGGRLTPTRRRTVSNVGDVMGHAAAMGSSGNVRGLGRGSAGVAAAGEAEGRPGRWLQHLRTMTAERTQQEGAAGRAGAAEALPWGGSAGEGLAFAAAGRPLPEQARVRAGPAAEASPAHVQPRLKQASLRAALSREGPVAGSSRSRSHSSPHGSHPAAGNSTLCLPLGGAAAGASPRAGQRSVMLGPSLSDSPRASQAVLRLPPSNSSPASSKGPFLPVVSEAVSSSSTSGASPAASSEAIPTAAPAATDATLPQAASPRLLRLRAAAAEASGAPPGPALPHAASTSLAMPPASPTSSHVRLRGQSISSLPPAAPAPCLPHASSSASSSRRVLTKGATLSEYRMPPRSPGPAQQQAALRKAVLRSMSMREQEGAARRGGLIPAPAPCPTLSRSPSVAAVGRPGSGSSVDVRMKALISEALSDSSYVSEEERSVVFHQEVGGGRGEESAGEGSEREGEGRGKRIEGKQPRQTGARRMTRGQSQSETADKPWALDDLLERGEAHEGRKAGEGGKQEAPEQLDVALLPALSPPQLQVTPPTLDAVRASPPNVNGSPVSQQSMSAPPAALVSPPNDRRSSPSILARRAERNLSSHLSPRLSFMARLSPTKRWSMRDRLAQNTDTPRPFNH